MIDSTTNLEELCYTFQTIERALGFPSATIFAFHGLPLSDDILHMLGRCSHRIVIFVDVTAFFHVFPYGFTPTPGVDYDKQRTEHFIVSDMWEIPHLEAHDVILRISDSTCLTMNNYDLPDFPTFLPDEFTKSKIAYQTQSVPNNFVVGHKYINNLLDATLLFMDANHIEPKNPEMWNLVMNYKKGMNSMPKLNNSFEIVRKEFMQRREVRAYHNYITNMTAEQFYNNNWSSDVLRFLTMAIFGGPEETYIMHVSGFIEKDFLKGRKYEGVCRLGRFGTAPTIE